MARHEYIVFQKIKNAVIRIFGVTEQAGNPAFESHLGETQKLLCT